MADFHAMLIDGRWVESESGQRIEVRNPADYRIVVGEVPRGTRADVDLAMRAADKAFPAWAAQSPSARAALLRKAAARVQEQHEVISRLLTQEQGKPLREARGETTAAIQTLEYYANAAALVPGEIIAPEQRWRRSLVIRQPVGPVAAIGAWNYPLVLIAWKLGPALAAGCTVVAKPPSEAPLAVQLFIKCLQESGLPDGVVNLVTGPGGIVGQAMVEHPLCRKVAFTGETATGKGIMRSAADSIKRVSLELGGHCPQIVCEDADLDKAAKDGVYRAFRNMGQVCNSINRIYVLRPVYEAFVEKFKQRTSALTIGDGLRNPDVDLGPMTNESGRTKTREHITDAIAKGAHLLYGGRPPEGERFAHGYFFEPTVLVDVNHSMKVMCEETFGPLAPIMPVDSLDDAISFANDSSYGLVAYVYTRELRTALLVSERLEYGTVGINNVAGAEVPYPYGGWKESGLGIECSVHALDEYLNVKHVRLDIGE